MRRARFYKRLAVALVFLIGMLIVLDVVALQVAESRAGAGFARSTAAERVTVDLGGFPFLPGLVSGRLRKIEVEGRGLSGGGLRVQSLVLRVTNISFSPSKAVALIRSQHASRTKVSASEPYGRMDVAQPDLEQFVKTKEPSVHDVRILPSGIEVRFSLQLRNAGNAPDEPVAPVITPPVRFLPRIEERKLVLTVVGLGGFAPAEQKELAERVQRIEHAIDLPPLPEGLSPPQITLGTGSFVVEATGTSIAVLVGEGGITSANTGIMSAWMS